jgi:hypothetical protein
MNVVFMRCKDFCKRRMVAIGRVFMVRRIYGALGWEGVHDTFLRWKIIPVLSLSKVPF